MNRDILICMLLVALGPVMAVAQEPLSLVQALERAHTGNPDLRALRERGSASALRAEGAHRQNLPRLGVEVGLQTSNNAASVFASRLNSSEFGAQDFEIARLNSPGALSHLGSSLSLEVPVDLAGRTALAADVQAAQSRAFGLNVREAESAVALQVTETYFAALLARRAVDTTAKAVAAARSREDATQARFNEGLALQADVLRVRARRRAREADLATRKSDLAVATAILQRLLGAPENATFDLTDTATPVASPVEPLDVWKARATSRPSIQASTEREAAATLATKLERRSSWPELAAQARLMDDRISLSGGGQSWAVGAILRWSVFDATRATRQAAVAADERAAAETVRATRDQVRLEVESAYQRLMAAQSRLVAAEGGALEGREALRVVQERRSQGLATLTDELETDAAAFAAELEEIDAARAAITARAALRRAAGDTMGSLIQ